ncbi:MAG: benzoate-CoA ligase family protein [Labilithrix sp.]|nr:benzoate-CoA ligase family protein [Labilithrix sp.]MCW5817323.1 benzoate-CoA ligase family protein [Labilithrix sp.]
MTSISFPEDLSLARYFLFDRLDEGFATKDAILFGERSWTYSSVADKTRRMIDVLASNGVRRGERVLVVLPDVPPFAWTFFGALGRGAVIAMGNPLAPPETLEYLVGYTRATAIVTVPSVAALLRPLVSSAASEVQVMLVVPDAATGSDPEARIDDFVFDDKIKELAPALASARPAELVKVHRDEPAIWLFTSGSTGEPKANVHTNRDFAFNTEVYAKRTVGYRKDDVTVSVPRLFFGYATGTNLMFPFAVGATTGLFSERPTPESVARAITTYKATIATNVPTMLGKLLEHDDELKKAGKPGLDLASIRFSLSAGEALPEPLLRRWLARTSSDVYDGIGSAEMFHIYASNRPGDIKPGSLGKVVDGYELRVLPEDAEGPGAAPCAPGEIGVLWVRGDSVSQQYWLDRDKSWRVFHGHWCRTGDLFKVDEEGYLYFAGRADDLLKVGGQWVAPLEVEECLLEHPAIAACAVIGVDEEGLVKTKAFVVVRAGHRVTAEEVQEHVRGKLAKYKYPRVVELVDDLPKNDRGKVDKKALKARSGTKPPA